MAPLDGGHIVAVISSKIWVLGVPMLLAIPRAWAALRGRLPAAGPQLTSTALKACYVAEYLGLAGFLGLMAVDVHEHLSSGGFGN